MKYLRQTNIYFKLPISSNNFGTLDFSYMPIFFFAMFLIKKVVNVLIHLHNNNSIMRNTFIMQHLMG